MCEGAVGRQGGPVQPRAGLRVTLCGGAERGTAGPVRHVGTAHPAGPTRQAPRCRRARCAVSPRGTLLFVTPAYISGPCLGKSAVPESSRGSRGRGGEEPVPRGRRRRALRRAWDSRPHQPEAGTAPVLRVKWLRFRQRSSARVTPCTWPSQGRPGCASPRSRGARPAHSVPRRQRRVTEEVGARAGHRAREPATGHASCGAVKRRS